MKEESKNKALEIWAKAGFIKRYKFSWYNKELLIFLSGVGNGLFLGFILGLLFTATLVFLGVSYG